MWKTLWRFIWRNAVIYAQGIMLTGVIGGILQPIVGYSNVDEMLFIVGFISAGTVGYLWGLFFGRWDYIAYKKMMADQGITVYD